MRILDVAVNVIVLIAAVMLCIRLGSGWLSSKPEHQRPAPAAMAASRGVDHASADLLGKPVAFRPHGERGGVVAVLSKTCSHCNESIPFYRSLNEQARQAGLPLSVAMGGTEKEIRRYLRQNGIIAVTPLEMGRLGLKVRFTPTVIVYDKSGTVTDAWVGRLTPGREQQVRAALAKLSTGSR